jgi:hypothetical protein
MLFCGFSCYNENLKLYTLQVFVCTLWSTKFRGRKWLFFILYVLIDGLWQKSERGDEMNSKNIIECSWVGNWMEKIYPNSSHRNELSNKIIQCSDFSIVRFTIWIIRYVTISRVSDAYCCVKSEDRRIGWIVAIRRSNTCIVSYRTIQQHRW